MKHFLIIIAFWNVAAISVGQSNQLTFQYLGEEQGLTGGLISAIQKDDLGFMWVGTLEGLFRYDGNRFEQFKGYSDTTTAAILYDVRTIKKDNKGQLWTGSSQGWISVINPYKNTLKAYQLPDEGIRTNTIWNISLDQKGHLWIAFERGLAYFNPQTERFKIWQSHQFINQPKTVRYNATYGVMVDSKKDHIIWIATRRYFCYFDSQKSKFYTIPSPNNEHFYDNFWRFSHDFQQNDSLLYVFGMESRIMEFHKTKQTWRRLFEKKGTDGDPRAFFKDGSTFWLGSTDNGLGIVNLGASPLKSYFYQNKINEPLSIKKGFVDCIFKDENGVFWFGVENGICLLTPHFQDFKHYSPKFRVNPHNFEQFSGSYYQFPNDSLLYFCSRYFGALHVLNRNTGEEKRSVHKELLPNKDIEVIWQIIGDDTGNLWVATDLGIYLYDKKLEKLVNSSWDTNHFLSTQNSEKGFKDHEGNIWFTGNLINAIKINVRKKRVEVIDCSKESPEGFPKLEALHGVKIDTKGYIWLSDATKLTRFDPKTKEIMTLSATEGKDRLFSNRVMDYWVASNDILWVFSKYNGIDRVDFSKPEGQRITHFGVENGLPSNKIYKIAIDKKEQIWIATGNGLTHFNTNTLRFTNYKTTNGLIDNNLHKGWHTDIQQVSTGEIIFSGRGYFTFFHPDSLARERKQPKLAFHNFNIFDQIRYYDQNLNQIEKVNLSYKENYFTVTFTDINFPYEQPPVYQYRLKGYDRKWRTTTTGKAEYTNIGGGKYVLEIRTIDENGIAISDIKSLKISISFPFWQTWWFTLFSIVAIVCGVLVIYNYRVQQVIEKEQLKTAFNRKIVEAEMIALRAQMNPHFMFNSLNSIKNYIIKNEARIAARYLTKFAKLMRLILNNSKSNVISISEELSALKLYIELEQLRFNHKFGFTIEQDENTDVQHFLIPPLILQPYVENAIWHGLMSKTDGFGNITIKVIKEKEIIHISICDNGIGRAKALELKSKFSSKPKSMGLQITKERLEMFSNSTGHSTNLFIEDLMSEKGHGTGTCVHLEIKIKN